MGLFNRRDDSRRDYNNALNGLNNNESARDRVHFQQISPTDDPVLIADIIIQEGRPLVLDFSLLEVDEANKDLAFISGVSYALDGEVTHIYESIYLFVRRVDMLDGTLEEMIREL